MVSPKEDRKLASGVPPPHAGAFIGGLLALAITLFPADLDDYASVETFTRRVFPELVSLEMLAYVRVGLALYCWMCTIYMLTCANPLEITCNYRPNSKLIKTTFYLTGLKHLCPFTSWSWTLLTLSFSTTAYITLMADLGKAADIDPLVLKAGIVLWEVASPLAVLVSTVVRYAIWPPVLASKRPHQLGDFLYQMQHNANSVFALVELCLLGGLPVKLSHICLPAFVGGIYILFTWSRCFSYAAPEQGPQYIYWFMDTSLGVQTTISLAALVFVLVLAFLTFAAIAALLDRYGHSLLVHVSCVVLVSSSVVKTS